MARWVRWVVEEMGGVRVFLERCSVCGGVETPRLPHDSGAEARGDAEASPVEVSVVEKCGSALHQEA